MANYIITNNGLVNTDTLSHHGVKGMKWGVRRYQNTDGSLTPAGKKRYGEIGPDQKVKLKEVRKERINLRNKYTKESNEYAEAQKLKSQAYALAKKYDFDGDDGGGGSTPASEKAGAKYMELWDKIDQLESQAYTQAHKRASNEIVKKYGEKRVNDITKIDTAKGVASVTAFLAAPIALAVIPEIFRK